ncbi:MAG: glycoside hydrolase [Actinobacteria bacterium]|nr:glycoside hydrolase [Actinomycetota bacterium]
MLSTKTCEFFVSKDAGRTWKRGALAAPDGYPERPCAGGVSSGDIDGGVVFGSGQNVYVTFAAKKVSDGSNHILVARSTDGGTTFATAVETPGTARYPKIAVQRRANGDRLYVAGSNVLVTRSDDAGQSWQPLSTPYASGASVAEATQPAVDSAGTVYIGWREGTNVKIGRSIDAGATWSQSQVDVLTSGGSNFPRLAVGPRPGTVYMTYGENPPAKSSGAAPAGTVVARDHFIPKDADVMVTASTDGGRTWSGRPTRVNDDIVGNGIAQRHPNISVAPDGRIDVVWHDRRHGVGSPKDVHTGNGEARLGDTYYSFSTDGGNSFAPNRRVTDRSINVDLGLDYKCCTYWTYGPVSVPIGKDHVLVAWPDTREGNVDSESQQIYLGDAQVVVVDPADTGLALVASVLARAGLGTVLTTGPTGLSAPVLAEVRRLGPVGAVLLGSGRAVPESVRQQLVAAGVPSGAISRIEGGSSPETAAKAASSLDRRSQQDKVNVPVVHPAARAFDAAVIVNPAAPESAAAAALAATFRFPVLLVDRDTVPDATARALKDLAIPATYVIGGPQAVSAAVVNKLPSPTRLGGVGAADTSESTLKEALRLGAPSNVVYAANAARPLDGSLLGAAVARSGGLLLLTPGSDPVQARAQLGRLGLLSRLDHLVVVGTSAASRRGAGPGPRDRETGPPAAVPGQLPATGGLGWALPALLLLGASLGVRRARS